MYYKISPIVIIILVVVLVAVAGLGISLVSNKSDNKNQSETNEVSEIVPVLDLSLSSNDENQENVIITATATTEDESGIYSITLPDGGVRRAESAEYNVTKNGNYTFKVKGNNGQTSSLTIEVNNIREASAQTPYIPTGFSHVEGEADTGYTIQDSYGNQFYLCTNRAGSNGDYSIRFPGGIQQESVWCCGQNGIKTVWFTAVGDYVPDNSFLGGAMIAIIDYDAYHPKKTTVK